MALCSAPGSPLTPLSFILHNHLGTSKPPNSGGFTLTNAAGIAKPVPEAHLKSLCAPSQRHHRVIPSRVGGDPCWDSNFQNQNPHLAPLISLVLETQQSSPSQGLSQAGTHIKEGTIPAIPILVTALPQLEPHHPAGRPGLVAIPAGHPLHLRDAPDVGAVSKSSSLTRKS